MRTVEEARRGWNEGRRGGRIAAPPTTGHQPKGGRVRGGTVRARLGQDRRGKTRSTPAALTMAMLNARFGSGLGLGLGLGVGVGVGVGEGLPAERQRREPPLLLSHQRGAQGTSRLGPSWG